MSHTAAFHEGLSAFEAGLSPTANRHPVGTRKYDEWLCGWRYAHDEFIYDDVINNGGHNESFEDWRDLETLQRVSRIDVGD